MDKSFIVSQSVTLIAAILALIGSILSIYISSKLALNTERRHLLWAKELDRFLAMEELVGELVEEVGGYRPFNSKDNIFFERIQKLERAAGQFARYPKVRQSIRDLHNTIGRMIDSKRHSEDIRPIQNELETSYRAFIKECDTIVSRPKGDTAHYGG